MEPYLPVVWAAIIGIAVAMYVILDGFDLGIGILFPVAEDDRARDRMLDLRSRVLGRQRDLAGAGGGGLLAPSQAYAVIMPALYLPVTSCCWPWCSGGVTSSSAPSRCRKGRDWCSRRADRGGAGARA